MILVSVIIRLFRVLHQGKTVVFVSLLDYLFVSVSSPLNKQYKYEKKKVERQGQKTVENLILKHLKKTFKRLKNSKLKAYFLNLNLYSFALESAM
ncbi:hypothetical protein SAMN04488029_2761 [Reichenbachiella faecimaris]|uniref:Uncharacterized protein n=1 Tax=Reichenbachiella faecimaris TaxID=692418 RepID=A0A1W2GIS3_REIFA|nr:hypothetical protein SAMN04488029_2761 [Reichenbachiella faecimaris]